MGMGLYLHVRSLVRPSAVRIARSHLSMVCVLSTPSSYPLVDSLIRTICLLCSFIVSTEIYVGSLPLLAWLGSQGRHKMRELITLLAITLYVGNALKDLVASPRPAQFEAVDWEEARISSSSSDEDADGDAVSSTQPTRVAPPPAPAAAVAASASPQPQPPPPPTTVTQTSADIRQRRKQGSADAAPSGATLLRETPDQHYATPSSSREFGFPSTHVGNHLVLVHVLASGLPFATRWAWTLGTTALVGWTRVYKRMHTPFDLVGGLVVGLTCALLWDALNLHAAIASRLESCDCCSRNVLAWLTFAIMLSHVAYPTPPPGSSTPSRDLAMRLLGGAAGVWLGDVRMRADFVESALDAPSTTHMLYRCAVGFPAMLASYLVADVAMKAFRSVAVPPEPTKLPAWFCTFKSAVKYGAFGWASMEIAPRLFLLLGI